MMKPKNIFTFNIYIVGNHIDKSTIIKNMSEIAFDSKFNLMKIRRPYYTVNFHNIVPADSNINVSMFSNDVYTLNIAVLCYNEDIKSKMHIPSWTNQIHNFAISNRQNIIMYFLGDAENNLEMLGKEHSIEHFDDKNIHKLCETIKENIEKFMNDVYGKFYLKYYIGNYCTYL